MTREGHPDNMSRSRMGRQVTMLLERHSAKPTDDPEFEQLHPLANAEDIVRFMTSYREYLAANISSHELTQKATAIDRYNTIFRETINTADFSEDNCIGSGFYSNAYKITVNGSDYVVRDITESDDVVEVDKHFVASLRVQDLDHVEHITAISYREGRTVSPLIPGELLQTLSAPDLASISKIQVSELYEMMKTANQRGVRFDGMGDNLLYDPDIGFTALDIYVDEDSIATGAAETLSHIVSEQFSHWSWTQQRGEKDIRGKELVRFAEIVRELIINDNESSEAVQLINETIVKFNQKIKSIAYSSSA